MHPLVHYGTISEAISDFKNKGFTLDFNLKENGFITDEKNKIDLENFEIVDMYRYEGDSDPADSAVVYALESTSGIKGIFVAAYGMYSDGDTIKMLNKLRHRK